MAGVQSQCTEIWFGDGVAASPVNITAMSESNGVWTITAATHGLARGDIVQIASVVGVERINSYFLVDIVDTDDFTVTDGVINGTYSSGGTVTKLNGSWGKLASPTGWGLSSSSNSSEVTDLDNCDKTIERVITTVDGTATLDFNYRINQASHGVVTGLNYMAKSTENFWFRIHHKAVSETTPPYEAFMGHINSFEKNGAVGETQALSVGFELNSPVLVLV